MRLAIAADHAGFALKQRLVARLEQLGHQVQDVGTHSPASCDYPDFAHAAAEAVATARVDRALLLCGTGLGMSMAANRWPGVRAARCLTVADAQLSRQHNDANALCLGARITAPKAAEAIVDAFLAADFEGGRHARRTAKIDRPV